MGVLFGKESIGNYDIIFTGIKENSDGDFRIKYFPSTIRYKIILKHDNPNFHNIYDKLKLNNIYTIMVKYKPSDCIYETFYLVDVLDPNVYKIMRQIVDIIDITKEYDTPLFQLVFDKPHTKRIVISEEEKSNIIIGTIYDIYYSKCEYGYLYLVTEIIKTNKFINYNKKTLSEETYHQT